MEPTYIIIASLVVVLFSLAHLVQKILEIYKTLKTLRTDYKRTLKVRIGGPDSANIINVRAADVESVSNFVDAVAEFTDNPDPFDDRNRNKLKGEKGAQ